MKLPKTFRPDKKLEDKLEQLVKYPINHKKELSSDDEELLDALQKIYTIARRDKNIGDVKDTVNKILELSRFHLLSRNYLTNPDKCYEYWIRFEGDDIFRMFIRYYDVTYKDNFIGWPILDESMSEHVFAKVHTDEMDGFRTAFEHYDTNMNTKTIKTLYDKAEYITSIDELAISDCFSDREPPGFSAG